MKRLALLFILLLVAGPSFAQTPTNAKVVSSCGTATYTAGLNGAVTVDTAGNLCSGGGSGTQPITGTTTTANSTIAVTNTFQAALASSATRKGCTLQNTGTHVQYIYFGTIGSATTSNAYQISPGQTISCAAGVIVLTDAVGITGTAGDGYIVTSQ